VGGPGVLEGDGAVEDEGAGLAVEVRAEVTHALELHAIEGAGGGEAGLDAAPGEHLERVRVEVLEPVVLVLAGHGVLDLEEAVVEAHLRGEPVLGRDPVKSALDLAAIGGDAAP
jgi:hypothetical protein